MNPPQPEVTSLLTKTTIAVISWAGSTALIIWTASRRYGKLESRVDTLEKSTPAMCQNNQALCKQERDSKLDAAIHKVATDFASTASETRQDIALIKKDIQHICEALRDKK